MVTVAASFTDVAGNAGTGGDERQLRGGHQGADTVSVTMSDGALKIGDTSTVTITFSGGGDGFDNSDVTVENGG